MSGGAATDDLGAGARHLRACLDAAAQVALAADVLARANHAGWLEPVTPGGQPFSVRQVNLGPLGWVSDRAGYRYQPAHPLTGAPWPAIPDALLGLWAELQPEAPEPECCLVNHYRGDARMGLHRDADEDDRETGIVAVSLGQPARFRLGGPARSGATRAVRLESGDVILMAGSSRNHYHGIDRLLAPDPLFQPDLGFDGRLSLTLRRVRHG